MSSLRDSDITFVDRRYGKNYVRLLHVRRDGRRHEVKELEVNTALTLNDAQDYLAADNKKIVATDSQKNTVYVLAKKLGVSGSF
jgi:urate oxidase